MSIPFTIADTFAGTPGDLIDGRTPTTTAIGAEWGVQSTGAFEVVSGPAAHNLANSNQAFIATNLVPGSDVIDSLDVSVTLDLTGVTPFGDVYGALLIYPDVGIGVSAQVIRDAGITKLRTRCGGSTTIFTPTTSPPWDLRITFGGGNAAVIIDGVTLDTGSGFDHIDLDYLGAFMYMALTAAGSLWTNFSMSGTYRPGVPPVEPAFWENLVRSTETP